MRSLAKLFTATALLEVGAGLCLVGFPDVTIWLLVGTCVVLASAGLISRMDGVALWPGVALHAVMAIWCAASFGNP